MMVRHKEKVKRPGLPDGSYVYRSIFHEYLVKEKLKPP